MLSMIDAAVTRTQFAAFPQDIAQRLLSAAEADIVEWGDRLLAAWTAGDQDQIGRARHSLKGLCGNFGAVKLLELSDTDLSGAESRDAYLKMRAATLYAIRVVALGLPANNNWPGSDCPT